ncbi:MAG: hypothetical protein DMF92_16785, partial [Acidobacteria bacterium]
MAQLHRDRRCQRQGDRIVDAVGSPLRGRPRTALGVDQSLRSGAQRLGARRHSSPDFQVHQRRQEAAADARRARRGFKRPTDIAWLPDGTFFVSDGYGNTRVAKFDKNGKFLMTWGTPGTGNGQFNTPHSIATDKNRRVYVSDRANNRIQVFDENGKYLDQFPNITQPYNIHVSADQYLWVFSGPLDKMLKYDLNGKLLYAWGTHGTAPGLFWAVHSFSADTDGNLYTAEVFGGRPQKFRPKPGADPAKVFHPQP